MGGSVLPSTSDLHLNNRVLKAPTRKVIEKTLPILGKAQEMTPHEKASIVFDMTVIKRDVTGDWIAAELTQKGFRVGVPLVSKWRSSDATELPTYAHIVALGQEFEHAYFKCLSKVNGWGRVALIQVAESLGEALAAAVGE
jgi:hypothetical protein